MSNNDSILWDKKYSSARTYESVDDLFAFSKNNPTVLALEPFIKSGMSILEVGSGTGELISYIQREYLGCKTVGVDFSSESIVRSTHIARTFNIPTSFIQSNIKALPFPDESFDIVFGDQVIGHIDNLDAALKEIYRVTKKDGIVAFSIANSLRPDGWQLSTKLSHSHQGYKQEGMYPWSLTSKMGQVGFQKVSFYGDMLFLFRNISLIRSIFKTKKGQDKSFSLQSKKVIVSENKSIFKRLYHYIDDIMPTWTKVTIGILARK